MNTACKALLALGAAFALCAPARAADAPPPVEHFFSNPELAGASISPSGAYLAVTVRNPSGRLGLMTVETANLKRARAAANFRDRDVGEVAWLNEDRLMYALYDSGDLTAAGNGSTYAVDRDGSAERQLTTSNYGFSQTGSGTAVKHRTLPWDYRVIEAMGDGSDDVLVYKLAFNRLDGSVERVHPYRLNTRTAQLSELFEGTSPPDVKDWVLDARGQVRFAMAHRDGMSTLYTRDGADGRWRSYARFSPFSPEAIRPMAPDHAGGMLMLKPGRGGFTELFRLDLATGVLAGESLLAVEGFDFVGHPIIDGAAGKVVGYRFVNDGPGTVWTEPALQAIQTEVDRQLPDTINTIRCGHCLSSHAYLVESVSDRQPPLFHLYQPGNKQLIPVGAARPKIMPAQMGTRDFVRFAARDGLSVPLYVTRPVRGTPPFPTVVMVHGGPWVRGATWAWSAEAQFLASRGYLVLEPEFRGSTGYGAALFAAGIKQWGEAMQDDLVDAVRWAVAQKLADPQRVAIGGSSYGGYATLMGLVRHPDVFRCGFEWAGVTDIDLLFTERWSDTSEEAKRFSMRELIGDPAADQEKFARNSPVRQAARITQPLLMAYGAEDWRVPLSHGQRMRDALRPHNPKVEWVVYDDEGHGWFREETRYDFWRRVERFLAANLGPAP